MIDNFSLGLTHGLMALAVWYLLRRPDLDREGTAGDDTRAPKRSKWGRRDA